jgi:hypothetical protein
MSSLEDAAAWLKEHVGTGGVFTKESLRSAFPNVTQIDRRVRDLRACGWVIDTRREDPALSAAEMRLVRISDLTRPPEQVSAKERRQALLLAAYSCVLCGAAGGSTYHDAQHVRVTLQVVKPGRGIGLVVCCSRCRADVEMVIQQGFELSPDAASAAKLSSEDWSSACKARVANRIQG